MMLHSWYTHMATVSGVKGLTIQQPVSRTCPAGVAVSAVSVATTLTLTAHLVTPERWRWWRHHCAVNVTAAVSAAVRRQVVIPDQQQANNITQQLSICDPSFCIHHLLLPPTRNFCFIPAQNSHASPTPILPYQEHWCFSTYAL